MEYRATNGFCVLLIAIVGGGASLRVPHADISKDPAIAIT
jgi:hypothetical protein